MRATTFIGVIFFSTHAVCSESKPEEVCAYILPDILERTLTAPFNPEWKKIFSKCIQTETRTNSIAERDQLYSQGIEDRRFRELSETQLKTATIETIPDSDKPISIYQSISGNEKEPTRIPTVTGYTTKTAE